GGESHFLADLTDARWVTVTADPGTDRVKHTALASSKLVAGSCWGAERSDTRHWCVASGCAVLSALRFGSRLVVLDFTVAVAHAVSSVRFAHAPWLVFRPPGRRCCHCRCCRWCHCLGRPGTATVRASNTNSSAS